MPQENDSMDLALDLSGAQKTKTAQGMSWPHLPRKVRTTTLNMACDLIDTEVAWLNDAGATF